MMVTIKVIKIRMNDDGVVVTMVIIVMSVVKDLKEELTESHLLASEQRSASCGDGGSVTLREDDNDYHDDDLGDHGSDFSVLKGQLGITCMAVYWSPSPAYCSPS